MGFEEADLLAVEKKLGEIEGSVETLELVELVGFERIGALVAVVVVKFLEVVGKAIGGLLFEGNGIGWMD